MRGCLAMLTLVGCATSYGAMGFTGGYEDQALGDGRYLIRVSVNGYTSSGTAVAYFHRRASELCPGGYDVESGDVTSNYGSYYYRNRNVTTATTYNKPEMTGVVRCRTSGAAAAGTSSGMMVVGTPGATPVESDSLWGRIGRPFQSDAGP